MKLRDYQMLADRTASQHKNELVNYALGLTGESGEVADMVKKFEFHGHDIKVADIKKELGDVLWYVSQVARVSGLNIEDIAVANIEKLRRRYPEGFSEERSINRVD